MRVIRDTKGLSAAEVQEYPNEEEIEPHRPFGPPAMTFEEIARRMTEEEGEPYSREKVYYIYKMAMKKFKRNWVHSTRTPWAEGY